MPVLDAAFQEPIRSGLLTDVHTPSLVIQLRLSGRLPNDPNIDRKRTMIQEDRGLVCGLGDRILKIRFHCLALWLPLCLRPFRPTAQVWAQTRFPRNPKPASWPC